ncbi:MAG TPA: type I-D CRISPR-associated protein Cas7/Csc2 [Ktedonobacteraceae bacterium]|nr:type I-D CRISPR-associated protein Cas7/Csc2 [Ktedonobacteraceae bacterium]
MSIIANLTMLNQYRDYLAPEYNNFPRGLYANLLLIRKTESETIFRTEGSGEGLTKEIVTAGAQPANQSSIRRVMISKRKQTAVERRTGRELLREHNLLKPVTINKQQEVCALNMNAPCGKCIDCMLYGYAVGGGGAQKSRVMTDDAYSIGPVAQVTGKRTFNATFDNGTMRNPLTGAASTSINEDEYVLPETHFLDIESLKDVTPGELQYVIGNVLRSSRYGAISSRLGRVRNTLAGIIFSDTEIFSNLELTQHVYDRLKGEQAELDFPLAAVNVSAAVQATCDELLSRVVGRTPVVVRGDALQRILDETIALYRQHEDVRSFLNEVDQAYQKKSN